MSHYPFFRPYNALLTREAVAPFCLAWKGQAEGGSGAAFAERPPASTHPSKGRDGHAESVLNRLLCGGSTKVTSPFHLFINALHLWICNDFTVLLCVYIQLLLNGENNHFKVFIVDDNFFAFTKPAQYFAIFNFL